MNEQNRVIHDHETKEYKEGWNANMAGKLIFANPYGCLAFEGELYRLWSKGFDACQSIYNNPERAMPQPYNLDEINNSFSITKGE